ncbi:MAG: DUF4952 domain-containing protein [Pseudomonas sp.]|uniref:DUF4952 domain-containing protein n=1 Tax=Pseudomonas fluorescens TaxID=294 RepID=UPI00058A6517|nr:DUF4952 domain-containing protein [Pseudomonas fluorescens]CEL29018.1 hypothetical protein SRM1_02366 [Pseudomonas fluorescens]
MNRLISLLFLISFSMLASCAMAKPRCDDFLAKLSDKPDFVEYVECTQNNDEQGKPLIARYRVKGSDALEAEKYMNQTFNLPMLRFICCGWDSTFYSYHDKKNQRWYLLGMGSEETPVNKRNSWSEIKFFNITVSINTEEI